MENARFILKQWKDAYSSDGDFINSRVVETRWTKPQHNWSKCNVDAATFGGLSQLGFGFVL